MQMYISQKILKNFLFSQDLISALNYMHVNKKYKELIFYMEACESGSMFNGLLDPNISIYSTTAANPCQSSFACFYERQRNQYLGISKILFLKLKKN